MGEFEATLFLAATPPPSLPAGAGGGVPLLCRRYTAAGSPRGRTRTAPWAVPFQGICTSSSLQSGRAGDPRQYRSVVILVSTRAISVPTLLRFARQAQYRFTAPATPQNPRQTALPDRHTRAVLLRACNIFT